MWPNVLDFSKQDTNWESEWLKMNFFPLYMLGKTSTLVEAGLTVKLVVFMYSILWSYEFYLIKTLLGTMRENNGHFGWL